MEKTVPEHENYKKIMDQLYKKNIRDYEVKEILKHSTHYFFSKPQKQLHEQEELCDLLMQHSIEVTIHKTNIPKYQVLFWWDKNPIAININKRYLFNGIFVLCLAYIHYGLQNKTKPEQELYKVYTTLRKIRILFPPHQEVRKELIFLKPWEKEQMKK